MSKPTDRRPHDVVITGVGMVTPLGDAPDAIHETLCAGDRGLRPVSAFDIDGLPPYLAGEIDFDHRSYFGRANVRPLDRTARLATTAALLALEASEWLPEQREADEIGLVLGTMFGSVHTVSAFDFRAQSAGPRYAKPLDFANSVINAAAGQVAIWHDLRGVNSTVTGGLTAGAQALAYAADLIRCGHADALLAGGAEELCFESLLGFHRAGRLSHDDPSRATPFAAGRDGFLLGEGAALLMLESAHTAEARGATVLARLRGWSSGFDCSRGEDADEAAATLARVTRLACDDAHIATDAIDAISASANGGPAGDAQEARGLVAALGDHGRTVPVAAVKSMFGECLGASAAFQATTMVAALRHGTLPGIPDLDDQGNDLPLTGARSASHEGAFETGLVSALGLDGNATALVLGR